MLADLARFCVRRRWIVVFAIWLPIVVVVNAIAGAAGSGFSTEFTPPDSESADVIEQLDWSAGQIIDTLQELEIDDRTMIVFTSDNGPEGDGQAEERVRSKVAELCAAFPVYPGR